MKISVMILTSYCYVILQMNLISPDTYAQVLFEICTYMYLKHVHASLTIRAK